MDLVRVSLFVATLAALIFQVTWLFWALAILLFCVLLLDYGQPRPEARPPGTAKAGEPVIIQSNADATAYNFVSELVSTVVSNVMTEKTAAAHHREAMEKIGSHDRSVSGKIKTHDESISSKIDKLSAKVDRLAGKPKK